MGRGAAQRVDDEALLELVHKVAHRLKRGTHEAIASDESGLSHMAARALRFFAHHPDATATDLVKHSGRDKGQIARVIGEVVERGLLERSAGAADRRSHALSLTPAGRAVQRRVHQKGMGVATTMFASFDARERAQLADFLRRIAGDNETP